MNSPRALLKHYLAAIVYRTQKALRDAPPGYPDFSAGHRARTPVEILRHMTSLLGYSRTLFLGGSYPIKPEPLTTFNDEIARFHAIVGAVGELLDGDAQLREISFEQFLQGPLSDVMSHVGQLALLRRLADAPVAPENFIYARIDAEHLGIDQAPPARPDDDWPECPTLARPPALAPSVSVHETFARQAIELARQARAAGNHPFGALLVLDGDTILTAHNTVATDRDPTAHAETNLVAQAIRRLSPEEIRRSVLYTSCEPCAMCVGKMYWAGIRSIAYALPAEELAALAGRDFLIPCAELFGRTVEPVTITGPLLISEAREVHLGFWR